MNNFRPPGWRHQGHHTITIWCDGPCQCRVIKHPSGHCLWCGTPTHKPTPRPTPRQQPPAAPKKLGGRPFAQPGTVVAQVHTILADRGPLAAPELADILELPRSTISARLRELRQHGMVERAGTIESDVVIDPETGLRGRARVLYRAVAAVEGVAA